MWTSISAVALMIAQVATQGAAPHPAPAAAAVDDSEKMVCKKVRATGSRIRVGKTCMTKAEWEQRTKDDQKALTDIQNGLRCSPGAC
jgi:hypothetical protein